MMRNAIRTAVSSVAYLRNLFDEEAFEDKNVSGLQLKVLRPFNNESKLILNWLEDGVFDALEKEYLKLLVFGIHGSCDELIESYHFYFSYNANGMTDINCERVTNENKVIGSSRIGNEYSGYSKEYARQQTIQLLRTLILLTQSLSPLPEIRYMSMKLWYYEDKVPSDYEPSHFRPARTSDILSYGDIPMDTTIGNVETKFHSLSVKVRSIVDEYDETFKKHISKGVDTGEELINDTPPSMVRGMVNKQTIQRYQHEEGQTVKSSDLLHREFKTNSLVQRITSPQDDRTIRTLNSNVDIYDRALEVVKFLKFVNRDNLAMALDIELEIASQVIEMLLETGILAKVAVRGKGYPVLSSNSKIKKGKTRSKLKKTAKGNSIASRTPSRKVKL
ncbi:HORMA domain-containing protein [Cryptosporidium muris RN66]|uniref:HORMA domain-containing protein n=1 Tax=Cryptosporidium muris (strain RN66) TaxID=441375 RepID=B6A9P8_CRYMR|nr:HORMA domain-containing protein [Cryptosporidium muris RN66]EEA04939.1 HORMA domain-containing protein [Cryptosporidium muris RN66]|eukprot:XP_002139288.1 HORMA domain-containing protein [Cryptosporidium muris RN66]